MATMTDAYHNTEKWLRLVTLINHAGKQLCKDVLHTKEDLPCNGAQLYRKLKVYKKEWRLKDQEEILCPPNGITDEDKFDIILYTDLIDVMFKTKYKSLITDLRTYIKRLCDMARKDISESEFNKEWNNACFMLRKHGFADTVADLKAGKLRPDKELLRKIVDSIERQSHGNFFKMTFMYRTHSKSFLKVVLKFC